MQQRWRVWGRRLGLAGLGLAGLVLLAVAGAWWYLRGSLAQLDGSRQAPGLETTARIARDAHGVPVISGGSRLDVAYATGFAHAQERYFQMDLLRRVAAGELSELFGARALAADKAHRLHRLRARAALALPTLPAADRALLERYAAGVNAGREALRTKPFEYLLTRTEPRAWQPADTLLVIWAMYFDLQGNQLPRELARGWLRDHATEAQRAFLLPSHTRWDAPLDAEAIGEEAAPIPASAPAWWGRPRGDGAAPPPRVAAVDLLNTVGSNNWALAGSRSASGAAIVADDMHLGINLPVIWYRAALQFPDGQGGQHRVVGVTLPGTPVVVAGSNGQVAWGYTNSYGDYLDVIALDEAPGDMAHRGQVRVGARWETPVTHEETIVVKDAPDEVLRVRETTLGPIRSVAGREYIVRWAAHLPGAVNVRARELEHVRTVDEAMALAPLLGIPAQNMVAGDAAGHIGWTVAGPLPRRVPAAVAAAPAHGETVQAGAGGQTSRTDGVAVDSSFPLSAAEGAGAWDGWLAPADYPKVVDPAGGQLYTANSRQLAGAGAVLLGDGGQDLGARTRQVRDGLRTLGDKADVQQVYAVSLDDRAIFLAPWRQRAIAALAARDVSDGGDAAAVARKPLRREALALLQTTWTGHASVDSVAYRITRGFMHALYDIVFEHADQQLYALDPKASVAAANPRWPVVLARLLDEQPPGWLPPRFPSWKALQLAALDRVMADLTRDGRPLAEATWGQRNTAASAHPMASAIPLLGHLLKVAPDMLAGDQHMPRVAAPTFGPSQRLAVSPGREHEGVFNMPGGQSGHPLSPYFLAGRDDWLAGRVAPLLPGPAAHTLTLVRGP